MRKAQWRKVARYVKDSHYRDNWRKVVQAMACIVVFCTTYALILPAITMETTYFCGMEAHTHEEGCYIQESCEQLICQLTEGADHSHGEDCYSMETLDVLICEQTAHIHEDICRSDPEADLETAADWESTLNQIVLTGDWASDLVSIASTQVGYQESDENYLLEDAGQRMGYTRYGAWYGIPYGRWDAMFVSFCLRYAGIPRDAIGWHDNSGDWLDRLKSGSLTADTMNKVPEAGDILFYREKTDAPVRAAIVLQKENVADAEDSSQPDTVLRIVEGDWEQLVVQRRVLLGEITLEGICGTKQVQQSWDAVHISEITAATDASVSEESVELTEATESTEPVAAAESVTRICHTENYTVTVQYSADLELPEGTELRVVEYPKNSDIFRQRCAEAGYELEWLLNIGFFLGDEELALDGAFDVLVTSKLGQNLGQDITHFADDGVERITAEDVSDQVDEGQTAVAFSADGFSDFGGGVAAAAETGNDILLLAESGDILGYRFKTVDPNELRENTDYVIYTSDYEGKTADGCNFMTSSIEALFIGGNDTSDPYRVGGIWNLSANDISASQISSITWRIEGSSSNFYLRSLDTSQYLKLINGWREMQQKNQASQFHIIKEGNGAGARVGSGEFHIRYELYQGTHQWKSTWNNPDNKSEWTDPTTVYFAEVTPITDHNYPDAVCTGEVHVDRLRFYNICEGSASGICALPGCEFLVEGTTSSGQPYSTTIISGESPQIALPGNIPDGIYTITEVSAPDGYMRDPNNVREFWIQNGALVSEHNIGTFLNHTLEKLTVGKTGEVEDYNNRIYQILLEAKSNLRMFQMDPIEVLFLVDKSNSMLFPSGLIDEEKSITLWLDNNNDPNDDNNNLGIVAHNQAVLNSLDEEKLYYIIADPEGTSTVYAIWYDGTAWMYQDASYYAKAKFENVDGYKSEGETVIFPNNKSYSKQAAEEDVNGINYRSNGGGLDYSSRGSTLGNYISKMENGVCTFKLYTAKDPYNRLHYLEEALANMIYELADANSQNRVILIPFTKEVQKPIYYPRGSSEELQQPVQLTTSNVEKLSDIVTHIDTLGGTRQDLALKEAYIEYLSKPDAFDQVHTYTILITDGAPVRSGNNAPPLGNMQSDPTTDDNGDIYGQIKGWGAMVKQESILMSVALGMGDVEGGSDVLEHIATDTEHFFCPLEDAAALTASMQRILFDGMKDKGELTIDSALIEDEITDSFYPIAWTDSFGMSQREFLVESNNKVWLLLQEGDWITLSGAYTTAGAENAAGQLLRREDGTYYIRWEKQTVSGSGWKGNFYVKAKEDFIGGNAIDTNQEAFVEVNDVTRSLQTPTVNVHLLDMTEDSSEVTLYLGDTINSEGSSPRDVVQAFYEAIGLTKVQVESQIQEQWRMNRYDPAAETADGLETNSFLLKYALGYQAEDGKWVPRILTNDEWATLESGGSLTFPYVYDTNSSHGDVGYFTVSLNKTSETYDIHTAEEACQPQGQPLTEACTSPAETYTLTVTYTAYELGEEGRPETNVNNGSDGPGTEVTKAAQGLNNGQGIIVSKNLHEVHVISGKILIEKIFTQGTAWTAGDTFAFQLTDESGNTETKTVTIGEDGKAMATFEPLRRGTYTVSEAADEHYAVKSIAVGESTNAYYAQPDPMQIAFTMGHNCSNEDVIGKAQNRDAFTSYIDPVNGVYGEAVFVNAPRIYTAEIPVEKRWSDAPEIHAADHVYLVLYLDDQPVLDTQGHARLLRLDAASQWKGVFTVVLANKDDSLTNYHYSAREASAVSDKVLNKWHPAVLENDGQTLLYYDESLEAGGLIGVGGKGYIVGYTTGENGSMIVTNYKSFDLPETGGTGTHLYTVSGLATLVAALMYGYSLRRKRERGASS